MYIYNISGAKLGPVTQAQEATGAHADKRLVQVSLHVNPEL